MKIFISGKMSNIDEYESRKLFGIAEETLSNMGHDVVNPWKVADAIGRMEREDYLHLDKEIIKRCDAIMLLSNWEESQGSKEEVRYAKDNNIGVFNKINIINNKGTLTL